MSRTAALWELFDDIDGDPFHDKLDDDPLVIPSPGGGPIVAGVPFLTTELGDPNAFIMAEVAFGANVKSTEPQTWNWYDITADVRQAEGNRISISPMGRNDESSQSSPAGCNFQLDNTTGNYTRNNPGSRWWPNVRRNTPLRIRLYVYGTFFVLFQGQINGWVPSWDRSGNLAVVTVSASGKTRQLNQGKTPLKSALYRTVTNDAIQPIAAWPMEEGSAATHAASALIGGPPMSVSGTVGFAANAGPTGSDNLPSFSGGSLSAVVPKGSFTNAWRLEFAVKYGSPFPANSPSNTILSINMNTTQISQIFIRHNNATTDQGLIFDFIDGGAETAVGTGKALDDGNWHWLSLDLHQSGANISYTLYVDNVSVISSSFATRTLAEITSVTVNPSLDTTIAPDGGQLVIWPSSSITSYTAFTGYTGENVITRMMRLCGEEGVPIDIVGASTTTMGPQGIATLMALLRECEATDDGLLYDGRGPGLGYVTRQYRYNAVALMTPDMAADPPQVADPFEPVDDDQRNRNIIKVDQKNGSSDTYEDTASPMGSGEIGDYDTSVPVNYGSESILYHRAAHEAKKGTVDEFRYPKMSFDLAATPALVRGWLATQLSGRIDVLNVTSKATQHPPGTVSQIVEGYSMSLSPYDWDVNVNCSPFTPWRVAVIQGPATPTEYWWRLDSGGSTLHQDYPAGTTSILVDVSDGYPWSTVAGNYPRDLSIGGIQVTATVAPTGSTQQTFTISATAYPLAGGSAVKLWRPPKLAL